MSEIHLPLGTLLGEDMAKAHLLVSHLASPGNPEALCSALSCFHLRHDNLPLRAAGKQAPLKLRYIKAVRPLFLLRPDRGDEHAHHLAFHEGSLVKIILYTIFGENRKYAVQHLLSEFGMCQLASAETDGDLDLVALVQELGDELRSSAAS